MSSVTCVDCNASYEIEDHLIPGSIQDGSLRERIGAFGTRTYMGICATCQGRHRRAAPRIGYDDELVRLRQLVVTLRERHPDWLLEVVTHTAVELLNDPRREPNPAFRRWLLERDE